jgi:hypothetical protein
VKFPRITYGETGNERQRRKIKCSGIKNILIALKRRNDNDLGI